MQGHVTYATAILALCLCLAYAQSTKKCCIPDGMTISWVEERIRWTKRGDSARVKRNETVIGILARDKKLQSSYFELDETGSNGRRYVHKYLVKASKFGVDYVYVKDMIENCFHRQIKLEHPDFNCISGLHNDYTDIQEKRVNDNTSSFIYQRSIGYMSGSATLEFVRQSDGSCQPKKLIQTVGLTNTTALYGDYRELTDEDREAFFVQPVKNLCRKKEVEKSTTLNPDSQSEDILRAQVKA